MTKIKSNSYPDFHVLSTEQDKIFWTITEVSDRLNLEPHTLRFWEKKFTKLHPTQKNSGTRYYKISDIHVIERIRDLLYKDGYTIEGAIKALNKKTSSNNIKKSDYKSLIENPQIQDNDISCELEEKNIATELLKELRTKHHIEEQLNKIIEELDNIDKLLD